MKNLFAIALVFVAIGTISPSASAQDKRLQATVPFNFAFGSSHLESGTYIVSKRIGSPFLSLRNKQTGTGGVLLTTPVESTDRDTSKLVFHRYGSQYFLSEVRCGTCSLNVHLRPSKEEKRARIQIQEAGLFPNDPILVALNY